MSLPPACGGIVVPIPVLIFVGFIFVSIVVPILVDHTYATQFTYKKPGRLEIQGWRFDKTSDAFPRRLSSTSFHLPKPACFDTFKTY